MGACPKIRVRRVDMGFEADNVTNNERWGDFIVRSGKMQVQSSPRDVGIAGRGAHRTWP